MNQLGLLLTNNPKRLSKNKSPLRHSRAQRRISLVPRRFFAALRMTVAGNSKVILGQPLTWPRPASISACHSRAAVCTRHFPHNSPTSFVPYSGHVDPSEPRRRRRMALLAWSAQRQHQSRKRRPDSMGSSRRGLEGDGARRRACVADRLRRSYHHCDGPAREARPRARML